MDHFSSQGLRMTWDMKIPSERCSPWGKPGLIPVTTAYLRGSPTSRSLGCSPAPGRLRLDSTSAPVFSSVKRKTMPSLYDQRVRHVLDSVTVLVPPPLLWPERGPSTHWEAAAQSRPWNQHTLGLTSLFTSQSRSLKHHREVGRPQEGGARILQNRPRMGTPRDSLAL